MKRFSFLVAVTALSIWPASFEVASIRRNLSGSTQDAGINISDGGRATGTNLTLRTLILQAYGILPFQLNGAPGWLDGDRYDIEAKSGTNRPTQSELRPSLQDLLIERFHLKAHRETKELTLYALVQDKNGLKLKINQDGADSSLSTQGLRKSAGKARIIATAAPMASLAFNLEKILGRVVNDQTGLTGRYDFTVEWELDQSADESTGPSLFTALREQLGLRVESKKGPVEVLVIDSVDRNPTEN